MIPLDEARRHVLAHCPRLDTVTLPLAEALGRVVDRSVAAAEAIPPFDNTAMDGFAVRAADTVGAPATLTLVGTVAAGDPGDVPVGPGETVRIMTGAPMPPGADAVVMVERASVADDGGTVVVEVAVEPGTHVRRAGDDLHPGDEVVAPGTELTPERLGLLASVGCAHVDVVRQARVGVFSTGDELVAPGRPLAPGQIHDSNRPTLLALLADAGCDVVDLGCQPDDEAAIAATVRAGAEACDALVTSGGVSMGDYDYVKVVLDRLGDMRWMQVAIRPAKPLAFGVVDGTPVFGLPGNPVSSVVSFELFARPALRRMMGFGEPDRPRVRAVADEPLARHVDGKVHFARVVTSWPDDGRCHLRSAGGQGSHQLAAMAAADALAILPDGDGVPAGGEVDALLLRR